MKMQFFGLAKWEEEYVLRRTPMSDYVTDITCIPTALTPDSIPVDCDADVISVFVNSKINRAVIDSYKNLRCIATRSTGFDHIDREVCKERSIVVSTVPLYGEHTVAEYAFALLLSFSRKIALGRERMRGGRISHDGLRGFDLYDRTLGIIGTGNIGIHVAQIARGFGMNVYAYDVVQNTKAANEIGFTYITLNELLAQSDVVSLHVPHIPPTHHLISRDSLALMKQGAVLVNTSRGGVVDTCALVDALSSGHIRGAVLDVFEGEELFATDTTIARTASTSKLRHAVETLMEMPTVILTPHNAFNTDEALSRILDTTAQNIVDFLNGTPQNAVSL